MKRLPLYLLQAVRTSVQDLAKNVYGLSTFDTALPQPWVNNCQSQGFDPRGVVVWSYDRHSTFGEPFPLTEEAAIELAAIFPGIDLLVPPQVEMDDEMVVLKLIHDFKVELLAHDYLKYKLVREMAKRDGAETICGFLKLIEDINAARIKAGG